MATKRGPPKSLSMFTGRKQNHLRTGAKFYVTSFRRDQYSRKFNMGSELSQFMTLKEAVQYARYYSRKNDNAYCVVGVSGYDKTLKGVYTSGKLNASLTRSFADAFGGKKMERKQLTDSSFILPQK